MTEAIPPVREAVTDRSVRSRVQQKPRNPGRMWAIFGVILLASAHSWAIWRSMEGWEGLTSQWPLWRHDHALYQHSAYVTRWFLSDTGTTAGYDPSFMSGYPKSAVYPASSTLPELVVAVAGGNQPQIAYKFYVLVTAALLGWLVLLGSALWGCRPLGRFVAVIMVLAYAWTDFPMGYPAFGMLPYFVAVPLGLVATGLFFRFCQRGAFAWWLASAIAMVLVVLVHFTSALFVAPTALATYLAASRRPDKPFSRTRHLGVWAIPALVLILNGFWWAPGVWLASTKGPSDFAFVHPEGWVIRVIEIITGDAVMQKALWVWGVVGLASLFRQRRPEAIGLLTFVASGFFWGYLAGGFRSLDFLQPGRHTYAMYVGFGVASGFGMESALEWLRRRSWLRLDVILGAFLLTSLCLWFGGIVTRAVQARTPGAPTVLSSRPSRELLWVYSRVKRYVGRGERLLYEESGFTVKGLSDPFDNGRFSGLLPMALGVELIGGPYLHASLTTNFTQFGEGKLYGRADWDRDWFVRYARLYRPAAILCWSPHARAFCQGNPDLIEIKDDDGTLMIARVKGFEGAAIEGEAFLEVRPGRIKVLRAKAGVDGTVTLRYHSVPCLRANPPVSWEPVFLEDDPVPFIRFHPPADGAAFALEFPPGRDGMESVPER